MTPIHIIVFRSAYFYWCLTIFFIKDNYRIKKKIYILALGASTNVHKTDTKENPDSEQQQTNKLCGNKMIHNIY